MIKRLVHSWQVFLVIAVLAAVFGGGLMLKTTHLGPWAFSDSASYVSAARNFNRGSGFVIVNSNDSLTHVTEFPPFYPIFLSFFIGENSDPNAVLRWVNSGLFIAFLLIFGVLLFKATRNNLLVLLGMAFCAASPVLLEVFSGVMSETLFLPLLCLILLLCLLYLEDEKPSLLVLLAVFSCLLPITRYAGLLFVGGVGLALLILSKKDFKRRLRDMVFYFFLALLPVASWFLRLYLSFNKVGGKNFKLDFSIFRNLFQSVLAEFEVIKAWLPYHGIYEAGWVDRSIQWISVLFFIVMIVFICRNYFRKFAPQADRFDKNLFVLAIINLCAYLLFIAFTHSITIPQIDIIDRMLAPIIPLFTIILVLSISALSRLRNPLPAIGLALVCLLVLRFNFLQSWNYSRELETNGRGYSARQYQESGIIDEIKSLPADQRMVSNDAGFILYYTNRFPIQIDQFANHTFGSHNNYGEKWVREKGAALILLYPEFRNYYGDTASQLLSTITNGLDVHYQDEAGGIYYYPNEKITPP